jgi:hypothetical protein
LKLADAANLFLSGALADAALDGREGVIAEIEPVAPEHSLQEKPDL